MNNDNESNLIAEYSLIQGAISNASNFIIQVFGFSIAAIVALIIASLQLKNDYLLLGVIAVTLPSASYISLQTRLITDAETYTIVFIEPYPRILNREKERLKSTKNARKTTKKRFLLDYLYFLTLRLLHT